VEVGRGDAEVVGPRETTTIHAGEEAALERGSSRPEIAAANDMAQRVSFGEGFEKASDEKPLAGLGSLRARKPGTKDEIDGAVRLTKHDVVARIAGAMARTEVDETFVNTTDQELEGVWRFPLPPDARLERLALEVDGQLIEGEFVDSKRASGIWRGVIQHAAPTAPKPVEEIVWVPGPWRDPALLEWQRGGRAELKIFPIPRKGTRRVVLAYTQHVAPAGSVRRWVYPLPPSGIGVPVDSASFDVRVVGAAPGTVRGRGYAMSDAPPEDGARAAKLAMTSEAFVPSGDLVVEYASPDTANEATATAFAPLNGGDDAFVALALRPRLPAWTGERSRDQVIVVDSGRSMFGERLRRAERLADAITQNMDRRDRVTVLACDIACRAMPGGWHVPGVGAAHDVDEFFAGLEADGASDLVGAVRAAAHAAGHESSRDLRVVLLSDGVASAGYSAPSRVASEVAEALPDGPAEVVAVPIGSDADVDVLGEIARGGGGAVVSYAPGESLE
jgi:Mg-chelatase subunit ChlD